MSAVGLAEAPRAVAINTQPLLRLSDLQNGSGLEPSIELSDALYAATVCHDGPFPWAPDTPIAARPALEQAAIAALPAGSFGPFGAWAARFGDRGISSLFTNCKDALQRRNDLLRTNVQCFR